MDAAPPWIKAPELKEVIGGKVLGRKCYEVLGGHDVRRTSYTQAVRDLQQRSNIFEPRLADACLPDLDRWAENVQIGSVLNSGSTIARKMGRRSRPPGSVARSGSRRQS